MASTDLNEVEVPELDLDYIDDCYKKLVVMDVRLDPNPLEYGPRRLNSKVASARAMLSNCERMYLQMSHDLGRFKRAHRVLETMLKLQIAELVSNDPETRAGKAYGDREAIARTKLQDFVLKVEGLADGIQELEAALLVVKTKRGDLRDIQARLKDQIRLCHDEIGLGNKWGSKFPGAPDLKPNALPAYQRGKLDKVDDVTDGVDDAETHLPVFEEEEDLDAALNEMLKGAEDSLDTLHDEIPQAAESSPVSESVDVVAALPGKASLDAVDDFLGADLDLNVTPSVHDPDPDPDLDLDDLLSSFG